MSFRRDRTGKERWVVIRESSVVTDDKTLTWPRRAQKIVSKKEEWLHIELSCGHWQREEGKKSAPDPRPLCQQCKYPSSDKKPGEQ